MRLYKCYVQLYVVYANSSYLMFEPFKIVSLEVIAEN